MWCLVLVVLVAGPWCTESADNHPCPPKLSLELVDAQLLPDANIVAGGRKYPPQTYWKDGASYFGCPCLITRCLRKCPGFFDSGGIKEIHNRTPFKIPVSHQEQDVVVDGHEHFTVFEGDICEINKTSPLDPENYDTDQYEILSNGSLHYTNLSQFEEPGHFCVRIFENGTIEGVAVCIPPGENQHPPKKFQHYLYPVLLLISVFFLILTLITYLFTPERNLHSRCMTVHCVCLAFGSFGLAVIQIAGQMVTKIPCYFLAFNTYYFLLSSFYWLNVMCFDIWCTFSGFKTMTGTLNQSSRKKFLIYCLYATVVPTVLFIITLSVQLTDPDLDQVYVKPSVEQKMRPGIGRMNCWFQSDLATFFYFNGPISILLILNLYFFISTTVKILGLKRETSMLKKDSESRTHNDDKMRFKLYFKLFLVMGLSWTFEIISWLGKMAGAPDWAWYLTDSFNCLQGFFIFVLCVWFTKSRNILLQRLCCKRFSDEFRVTTITQQPGPCTKSSDASESGHQQSYSMKALKSNRNQFD